MTTMTKRYAMIEDIVSGTSVHVTAIPKTKIFPKNAHGQC